MLSGSTEPIQITIFQPVGLATVLSAACTTCVTPLVTSSPKASETLPEDIVVQKALQLVHLGIDTLVCGAISRPLLGTVRAYGIKVIPFVAGDLRKVIQAWLSGSLTYDTFGMPGCRGRGRRRFRGMHDGRIETVQKRRRKGHPRQRNRQP